MPSTEQQTRLAHLSAEQRRRFQAQLRGRARPSGQDRIPPATSDRDLPLSYAQERHWFLQEWDPGSSAYNCPVAFRLRGTLNSGALQLSLDALVSRHEVFRTRFTLSGDAPRQTILPPVAVDVACVDLMAGDAGIQDSILRSAVREHVERPFDLTSGRLLRASLITLASDDHVLALTTHHIISDAWSRAVMLRELETLYSAFAAGVEPPLDEIHLRYRDVAVWQRERFAKGLLGVHQTYWRRQLSGAPRILELPGDYPRPAQQSFAGATHRFLLPVPLVEGLRALGRSQGATLFMTLLAGFGGVLSRWTGRDDMVIGSPVAGRTPVETEPLIGCFINTLPLRLDLSGAPSFHELLKRVRRVVIEGSAHGDLPFERLIDDVGVERSAAFSPLVQVMFQLRNHPQHDLALSGLTVEPFEIDRDLSKLDLTLDATETPDGLACVLEYRTDLFAPATIDRIASNWQRLLEAVVREPDRRVEDLSLVSAAERAVLARWNQTDVHVEPRCIHELFETQVAQAPDATAICADGALVTYRQLNARAVQLAHVLMARGIGAGALVGVCLDRSVEMVAALVGILKIGAAYVPLDRSYPDERLAAILSQAHPAASVCDGPLPPATAACAGIVVDLREADPPLACDSIDVPGVRVAPTDLAYVLFTSGSTGVPKGVMMPHAAVCNHIEWMQRTFPIGPGDRVLHHTSIGFDVSVGEIFGTLAAGGTLVLAEPGGQRDPAYLARVIAAERVTVVDLVPRMLQAIMDEPAFDLCTSLRQVHCGAETLPPALACDFRSRSDATLLNFYGPTETCIDVAVWRCAPGPAPRTIPIGRPIANVRIHLLDRERRLVPIGQPGEIYVGGAALARGYLARPDLDAEAFVPNPIDPEHSSRLYRTGDIGRYLPDGAIEFLGRRDRQIKVRGVRVELAEVESVLRQLPGIVDCIVHVHGGASADSRIVAYVESASASDRDVRQQLAARLPSFMLPDVVVPLPRLPRAPGGKIDMSALPEPVEHAAQPRTVDAPETQVEAVIAEAFAAVLSVPGVGRHDSFFERGGHSLLAARLMSTLRASLDVELPLRILFEHPSVASLASAIAEGVAIRTDRPDPIVAVNVNGRRRPFFFLHAALTGEGFYSRQLAWHLGADQPFYGFAPLGLDGEPIPETVEDMAAEYIRRVRGCQPEGPYRLGGFCLSGPIAFEMARQLREAGDAVEVVVVIESSLRNAGSRSQRAARLLGGLEPLGVSGRRRAQIMRRLGQLAGYRLPRVAATATVRERVEDAYRRACAGYAPRVSDVRVVQIWARERTQGPPFGWQEISTRFSERIVPGDHDTCVTTHLQTLASAVAACLEEP